jgi:hypothetical protein
MAGVIENYSNFEVHAVIRFLQAERVIQGDIHRRLVSVYVQKVFSRKEASVWCNKFKDGRRALNDGPKNTDENCVIGEGMVREDGRIEARETKKKNSSFAILYFPCKGTLP